MRHTPSFQRHNHCVACDHCRRYSHCTRLTDMCMSGLWCPHEHYLQFLKFIKRPLSAHLTQRSCAYFGEHCELVTLKDDIINYSLRIQGILAPYCCYRVSSCLIKHKKRDTKYFCQYSFEVPNDFVPEYYTTPIWHTKTWNTTSYYMQHFTVIREAVHVIEQSTLTQYLANYLYTEEFIQVNSIPMLYTRQYCLLNRKVSIAEYNVTFYQKSGVSSWPHTSSQRTAAVLVKGHTTSYVTLT